MNHRIKDLMAQFDPIKPANSFLQNQSDELTFSKNESLCRSRNNPAASAAPVVAPAAVASAPVSETVSKAPTAAPEGFQRPQHQLRVMSESPLLVAYLAAGPDSPALSV